jgi:hypothetical protein
VPATTVLPFCEIATEFMYSCGVEIGVAVQLAFRAPVLVLLFVVFFFEVLGIDFLLFHCASIVFLHRLNCAQDLSLFQKPDKPRRGLSAG